MTAWASVLSEFPVPAPARTTPSVDVALLEPRPRAVLFDVYGTLLCPMGGCCLDGFSQPSDADSFTATAERFGFSHETGLRWHEWFFEAIGAEHRKMETLGIVPAEVQVDHIWKDLISRVGGDPAVTEPRRVAAYSEMLANPVRAFTGAGEALKALKNAGVVLGIVSNSQFYTMAILGRTLGIDPDEFFDSRLIFLSFRLGFGKPNPHFFRLVRTGLLHLGFEPAEALVVGNDLKNDVLAAQAHGLQAILFQGNGQNSRPEKRCGEVALIRSYDGLLTGFGC